MCESPKSKQKIRFNIGIYYTTEIDIESHVLRELTRKEHCDPLFMFPRSETEYRLPLLLLEAQHNIAPINCTS